jgi:predicted sulfurtransferase
VCSDEVPVVTDNACDIDFEPETKDCRQNTIIYKTGGTRCEKIT